MLESKPQDLHPLIGELSFLAQRVAHGHRVHVVKYLGGGGPLLAAEPQATLDAGMQLVAELGQTRRCEPQPALPTRACSRTRGDWFDPAVNLASRLAEFADPDEVLLDLDGWPVKHPRGSRWVISPRGLGRDRSVCAVRVA